MKKLLLLLVTILLFSCSKEDDSANYQSNIIGKWHIKSSITAGISRVISPCENQYGFADFYTDGNLITRSGEMINGVCHEEVENYSYTVNGNILSVFEKNLSGNITYESRTEILELTQTTLKTRTFYFNEVWQGISHITNIPENLQDIVTLSKVK